MSQFLDYLALGLLLLSLTAVSYLFIYIHELPHKAAIRRNHPHAEAIGIACWLSLFTLHAIWPIVFIWAVTNRKATLVPAGTFPPDGVAQPTSNDELLHRLAVMEERLRKLEAVKETK